MKKLFLTIFIILCSIGLFAQVNIDMYIGLTKKDIKRIMKDELHKVSISDKLYVLADENGGWKLDDNNYSYMFIYDDNSVLVSFDNVYDKCVRYCIKTNIIHYNDYMDFFNNAYEKNKNEELSWYDDIVKIKMYICSADNSIRIFYTKK